MDRPSRRLNFLLRYPRGHKQSIANGSLRSPLRAFHLRHIRRRRSCRILLLNHRLQRSSLPRNSSRSRYPHTFSPPPPHISLLVRHCIPQIPLAPLSARSPSHYLDPFRKSGSTCYPADRFGRTSCSSSSRLFCDYLLLDFICVCQNGFRIQGCHDAEFHSGKQ